jgi:lysozyme
MNVSSTQINTTAGHEGFRATAYKDGSSGDTQKYSIGFGHSIQLSEGYLRTKTITKGEAKALMLSDFRPVVNAINNTLKKGVNQNQFDALCDFGYNAGVGALASVLGQFNASGASAATSKMLEYVKWHPTPGGALEVNADLVKRRNEEIAVFNGVAKYSVFTILILIIGLYFGYEYFYNGKITFFS